MLSSNWWWNWTINVLQPKILCLLSTAHTLQLTLFYLRSNSYWNRFFLVVKFILQLHRNDKWTKQNVEENTYTRWWIQKNILKCCYRLILNKILFLQSVVSFFVVVSPSCRISSRALTWWTDEKQLLSWGRKIHTHTRTHTPCKRTSTIWLMHIIWSPARNVKSVSSLYIYGRDSISKSMQKRV